MTENKRIFLNVIATYGRSLFSLVCGLFTARWVLNSLGTIDFGLYGVVAGLTTFIGFINGTLAHATSRFYSVSIGSARRSCTDRMLGLEECRTWFNTALILHSVVPIVLVCIGYPIGVWAIRSYLTIPPERIAACIWTFRFACLSCFVGMINVPFTALYNAKQYIAELTIYSYLTTTVNVGFGYYMISHPGDWLIKYAFAMCLLSVVPQILICIRAFYVFPECRINISFSRDFSKLCEIGRFAGWNMLGSLCGLLRIQGVSILINKAFGSQVNAAMGIGNSVNGHVSSLSVALMGAFQPAIITAYGEGLPEKVTALAIRACKFGVLLTLVFAIPLLADMQGVLQLWLKTPPAYTVYFCVVVLLSQIADVATQGHTIVVFALGKVREYQVNMTTISILTLPAAIIVFWLGGGVYAIGIVLLSARILIALRRVYYAYRLTGFKVYPWIKKVVIPVSLVGVLSFCVALIPRLLISGGIIRIALASVASSLIFVPLSYFFVLEKVERTMVNDKFNFIMMKAGRILRLR